MPTMDNGRCGEQHKDAWQFTGSLQNIISFAAIFYD